MLIIYKEIEENKLKECSFKPDINKKAQFDHIIGFYSDFQNVPKRISLENREKQVKIQEIKK